MNGKAGTLHASGCAATEAAAVKDLRLVMKFVCGQCWRDGLVSEADKALKYCTAKARHGYSFYSRTCVKLYRTFKISL